MLFRSAVPFAVLCSLLLSLPSPGLAQEDVNKIDLVGKPVPYKGELVGGWRKTAPSGDGLDPSSSARSADSARYVGSTTLPPLGCRAVTPPRSSSL
jgi:hypothetical protein